MEPSTQTIQVTDCCKNMPYRNVHNSTNVRIASAISTSPTSEIRNNGKRNRDEQGCTPAVQRANKIRAIQKPLDALAVVLTKHVAKATSSVFGAQTSVQSSVNLHSGGVMKLEFLVNIRQRNSTDTTNTANNELLLVNDTLADLQATILEVKRKILLSTSCVSSAN